MAYLDGLTRLGVGGPGIQYPGFAAQASATLTGTVFPSFSENEDTSGLTIIWTLTAETFVAAGTGPIGSTADSQALIDSLIGGTGWNTARSQIDVTDLVRTSDTVATLTLPSLTIDVTADETVSSEIPSQVLTGNDDVLAVGSFIVEAFIVARKGGRTRRKSRYLLEIDGQIFLADTVDALRGLLKETKEVAREVAPKQASQNIRISPPKIRVSLQSGTPIKSKAVKREVQQTQNVVNSIYRKASKEIQQLREIAEQVEAKRRQDEDDVITSLLL